MTQCSRPTVLPMTTMTFVRIIFWKDVRQMRLLLGFMLGAAILLVAFAQPGDMGNAVPVAIFLQLLCLCVIIRLMLTDPVGREYRFLLTRPVPGLAVLIAKGLFLTLFLIAPACVLHEAIVARFGIPLLPLDHFLMGLETVISVGFQVGIFVLMGLFFRSMTSRESVMSMALFGAALTVNAFFLGPQRMALQIRGTDAQIWFLDFTNLAFEFLVIGVVVLTAFLRYRTKRYWLPIGTAAVGLALSSIALWLPAVIPPVFYPASDQKARLTAGELNRVSLTIPKAANGSPWNLHFRSAPNGLKSLFQIVSIEGVHAPCYAVVTGAHGVLTLPSGKTFTYNSSDFSTPLPSDSIPDYAMAMAASAAQKPEISRMPDVELFRYDPARLSPGNLAGAQLQGTITVQIRRAYLAGSLPLKEGATLVTPRHRTGIVQTHFAQDYVDFSFDTFRVPLILRGESWNRTIGDAQVVVVYRPLQTALHRSGGGSEGSPHNDSVQAMRCNAVFNTTGMESNVQLPPDWATGAELDFIDSEPCGEATLPYKIEKVNLER